MCLTFWAPLPSATSWAPGPGTRALSPDLQRWTPATNPQGSQPLPCRGLCSVLEPLDTKIKQKAETSGHLGERGLVQLHKKHLQTGAFCHCGKGETGPEQKGPPPPAQAPTMPASPQTPAPIGLGAAWVSEFRGVRCFQHAGYWPHDHGHCSREGTGSHPGGLCPGTSSRGQCRLTPQAPWLGTAPFNRVYFD